MKRFQHPSCNAVLAAPPGMSPDECGALAVRREHDHGVPRVCSFWKPSPTELQLLNEGCPVMLSIMGRTMPPAYVGVEPYSPIFQKESS